jgi:hypothetical protein
MRVITVVPDEDVRAAIRTYASESSSLRFELLPLTVVAEPGFYAEIAGRLDASDLVIDNLTPTRGLERVSERVYGLLAGGRRISLATWPAMPTETPVVDTAAGHAGEARRARMPWRTIAKLPLVPFWIGAAWLFATRRDLARWLLREQAAWSRAPEPGRSNRSAWTRWYAPQERHRMELLVKALGELHRQRRNEELRVAVPVEDIHVPWLDAQLQVWGYAASDTAWVRVFGLDGR